MSRRSLRRGPQMAPFDVLVAASPADGSWRQRVRACLEESLSGRRARDVLALTFFSGAADASTCARHRADMLSAVSEFFSGAPPPAGLVAQAPKGHGCVALEATVLADSSGAFDVARRECSGVPYTLVSGPASRQIHCSGIASDQALDDRAEQSRDAFAQMEAVLLNEGLTFGHVVRQWNYIEGVLDIQAAGEKGRQGYQAFNDVRTLAYGPFEFSAGYPAATGIGQATGGVVLGFLALEAPPEVRIEPLSNPRQTDAHRYSTRMLVGEPLAAVATKCTPKFERAKLVAAPDEEIVFVSGTAAIVGERSVAPGDVSAQTKMTIENIATLVGDRRLSHLRAYVKRESDIPAVRRICLNAFGPIPALYVTADVCRDELLVELEGALVKRTTRNSP